MSEHPESLDLLLEPEDNERLANLCGLLDEHLRLIERRLGIEINNRGASFRLIGEPAAIHAGEQVLRDLYHTSAEELLDPHRLHLFLQDSAIDVLLEQVPRSELPKSVIKTRRGMVRARGPNQQEYLHKVLSYDISFVITSYSIHYTKLYDTCSIREKAQEKVFSQLGRWRPWKEKNPNLIIGVGGCVASQEGDAIRQRAPYVDLVFGPQTLHRLPEMIREVRAQHHPVVDVSFPEIEKFDRLPEPRAEGPTAFVSIMEGCSKYCTYCVVPFTRGEEISRPFDDVIAEVAGLAAQGVREVNLLGQNVNAYRGEMHDDEAADLALLIEYVAAIDGIERIRFTTSHPLEFSDSLIEAYGRVPELVSFVHLPVQSGSDRVLAMMKRGHMAIEYKAKIRKLREVRPDITISSDFIVGFPGETERDS